MRPPLALIPLVPLAGFLLNGMLGNRLGRRFVTVVGCGLPMVAFVLTLQCFARVVNASDSALHETLYTWASFAGNGFEISFWFDRLTAVMALIVTGVGSLIHLYSAGYMREDASYARYFAYLNLFLFFMLLLVLGRSMLVLFVGWEGVGLASYLLIGFWFAEAENARAGKKAFIANRIGDAGFLAGMFLLYTTVGTLDMDRINAAFRHGVPPPVSANLVAVLLLIGATGKSAQIPLYVWLPDAMAGPTPVSALIHAATMVTAGVYLIARLSGLYVHAPEASQIVAATGVLTALLAAAIAIVQTDIKRVLAYSTISQLGLMFVALGVGAYAIAVFHVYTHAFFKACLFLGAGSVIHALSGEQDIRRMGGLARKIPVTFATFAIATAAIAGLPPLAGFFSKDEILWFALASTRGGSPWLWGLASFTALLTAFYMFRLLWLTFLGVCRVDPERARHVHESPWSMTSVLVVLASLSAVGGFVPVPHFLDGVLPAAEARESLLPLEIPLVALAVALGVLGLAAAAWAYRGEGARAARIQARFPRVHRVLAAKLYVDEAYERLLMQPLLWVSDRVFLRVGERVLIDGTLNGLVALATRAAARLTALQTGQLHAYAFFLLVGLIGCLAWIWSRA